MIGNRYCIHLPGIDQVMIRVHTHLKYARFHLQECEAALEEGNFDACLVRASDVGVNLVKALAEALPGVRQDLFSMDERCLARTVDDLSIGSITGKEVSEAIFRLRNCCERGLGKAGRPEAEGAFVRAGEAFRLVHDLLSF